MQQHQIHRQLLLFQTSISSSHELKVISRACVRITVQIQIVCWTVHSLLLSSLSGCSLPIPLCFSLHALHYKYLANKKVCQDLQLVYWHLFFSFPILVYYFQNWMFMETSFLLAVCFFFPTNFMQGLYTYTFSFCHFSSSCYCSREKKK